MAEAVTIPDRKNTNDVTDIRFLRETGLRLLQKYSGNVWTDYNTHDPGVTILETLCLALAEVGYRSSYDITELLGQQAAPGEGNSFLPCDVVLPSSPVTLRDMRKLLLDISGVHNLRILPYKGAPEFRGLYEIEVLPSEDTEDERAAIIRRIRETLDRHRQPGQEFITIRFLESELIGFELDVEVDQRVDNNDFYHLVASTIENYLSPSVHFSSFDELTGQNKGAAEIFNGPMLENAGFITDETLEASRLRKYVYTSDLVSVLMETKNIKLVKKIILTDEKGKTHNWLYKISPNKVPRIDQNKTNITIRYRGAVISSGSIAHIHTSRNVRSMLKPFSKEELAVLPDKDTDDRLREYYSVGQDLPDIYGVGEYGLPYSATVQREALVHQLRAYLSIFDQVLSGSFAQLAFSRQLLSPVPVSHSYAAGSIGHLDSGEYLFKPFLDQYLANYIEISDRQHLSAEWEMYKEENAAAISKTLQSLHENEAIFLDRRNRALSHLLSRFGYNLSFFEYVCGFRDEELIRYKEQLLEELPHCDLMRSVLEPPQRNYLAGDAEGFSGLEKRLALLTGIRANTRKALSPPVAGLFSAAEGEAGFIDVEVFCSETEKAIDTLIATGGSKEMYITETDESGFHALLYDAKRELCARFTVAEEDPLLTQKLSAAFSKLDLDSEGFHIVDHLLLRPEDELNCFGFDICTGIGPDFTCSPALTRKERDRVKKAFLEGAANETQYKVTEIALRQFRISHLASPELHGTRFYSSREEAIAEIEEYIRYFTKENREEHFVHTTSFRDQFSDTEDPFSGILTVVLPSWPSRFSNNAYRKFIEEVFARETPAHLVVNIRWFCYEQMKRFETAYASWLDSKFSPGISSHEKRKRLETLLNLLAA